MLNLLPVVTYLRQNPFILRTYKRLCLKKHFNLSPNEIEHK